MKITEDFYENISNISNILKTKESFDIIERVINIADKKAYMYYIDGFVKDDIMYYIMAGFFKITKEQLDNLKTPKDFIETAVPYVEVAEEISTDSLISQVLSGQTAVIIEGYDKAIMIDSRTYPARGPQEPEKEKVLRGSRDGFVETIVFNTAMIRRRIRDPRLIFEMTSIGKMSKTDVTIAYIDGVCDEKTLAILKEKIDRIKDIPALTMGNQSLVELLTQSSWLNPFPKVRYTERPDVASAHLMEGKVLLLVDNSPSAIMIPTSIFDFLQDVDDYYLPVFTGNYLRITRNLILLSTVLLSPLYMLIVADAAILPTWLQFLLPKDPYTIPLVIQFLLLELAIDGLKLASLNTPGSLGMSLSVVGALILGDLAVSTGWFIPQSILYMAVVALGSFSQPSIELGYALKFIRLLILILTAIFGKFGFWSGVLGTVILIALNKTVTGTHYLYPLIPFNWSSLKSLLFRTRLIVKQTTEK